MPPSNPEGTAVDEPVPTDVVLDNVPVSLRIAAAWSWRLIVVGIVVFTLFTGFTTLAPVALPVIIALLIAAPLEQLVGSLHRRGLPRAAGAALALLALILAVVGLGIAAGSSVVAGFGELQAAAIEGFYTFLGWLVEGPLHMSQEQIDQIIDNAQKAVQENAWGVATGAFTVTGAIGSLLAGSIIALFALFFFLKDGRKLWVWFVNLLPKRRGTRIDRAGMAAWLTLRRYTETSVFVAFIDAVGIGLGAWLLGLPLALPIAIIVFLLSFIPLFGATISGAIAVAVALVDGGPIEALWMAVIVLAVQQFEGNVLYPWLFGKAASLHPLVILLSVSTGTLLLGLVGAVIAVPIVSFFYAFARSLHRQITAEEPDPDTGQILTVHPREAIKRARDVIARTGEIRIRRHPQAGDGAAPGEQPHPVEQRQPRDRDEPPAEDPRV